MLPLIETIPSIIVTATVTLGFLWMLYPAWAVLVAERLEWEVEQLSSPDMSPSSPDTHRPEPPLLSLVIPAYNEQDRIPIMIRESFDYLTSPRGKHLLRKLEVCVKMKTTSSSYKYELSNDITLKEQHQSEGPEPVVEWLIVNDGSNDSTCDLVRETYNKLVAINNSSDKSIADGANASCATSAIGWKWKIVSLKRNAGKGAAVKTGMNLAEGTFHLMVDADGATDFGNGLENLTRELQETIQGLATSRKENGDNSRSGRDPMIAVFGSRAHLEKESTAQRSFVRTVLMKAFHFFVTMFVSSKVHDTQCGFKLFTNSASCSVFETLHLRRWAFDTEIVLLCDKQGIDMLEIAVPWKEVDGSKLSTSKLALAIVSISMLRDMICVWACYTLGIWKVKNGLAGQK